jgi:hypothetical protein
MPLPAFVIPLVVIETGLRILLEAIKVFGGLPKETQNALVQDALKDKTATKEFFNNIWKGLVKFFARVKFEGAKDHPGVVVSEEAEDVNSSFTLYPSSPTP